MEEPLNLEQQIAVDTLEGPVLVLAGAGSGKTRVVTFRIANLLRQGVLPSQILGLTFTNKAAGEMRSRVLSLTRSDVLICTFHSLGSRMLRESIHHLGYRSNFTIYDDEDTDKLIKVCLNEIINTDSKESIKEMKRAISTAKNSMLNDASVSEKGDGTLFSKMFALYQAKLKEYNAVDYDDLLALPVRLFREFPSILEFYQERWTHLLIDEYQDTNALQYTLVNYLTAKRRNICVVGDPDQSIYSWRGANINNILNFENDYPGAVVVRLDQNYRSRSNILEASNALISKNAGRYEKNLWSARGEGDKIREYRADNDKVEASFVAARIVEHHKQHNTPLNQMVVFYRTNAQSRVFEDCLLQRRIPYVIVGGISFYHRREIKDILGWLRMVMCGDDYVSFLRTINLPKRGLGDATLEKLRFGAYQEKCPILEFCEKIVSGTPIQEPIKLTAKQKNGLTEYVNIIHRLREISAQSTLTALVAAAIDSTGYIAYLEEDKESMVDRKENLNALVSKAAEWEESTENGSLMGFLEELSLKSTLDEAQSTADRLNLMTIHNGKGLEFDVTFLVGMEEDLFPHVNSRESEEGLEEERRLCYVGMTRAKEHLYLTYAISRTIWGVTRTQRPSRFLREIPLKYVEKMNLSSQPTYQAPVSRKYISEPPELVQPSSKDVFAIGDFVFHHQFGVGNIRQVYENSTGLTYRVFFSKDSSERNLVAKYANLARLE